MQKSAQMRTRSAVVPVSTAKIRNLELSYPTAYAIYQKENSPYTKTLNTIVWYEDTESNRHFFTGGVGSPSEPPVAISLDIYSNPNNLTPYELLSKDASYLFAKGVGGITTLAGQPATILEWDSLYRGKSVVVNNQGLMYVFSVTSIAPSDAILSDFDLLLSSVSFK